MATTGSAYVGSGTQTGAVTLAKAATFIPEVWSDEILVAYKKKLVMANLVRKMSFVGKKGDTLHIPAPQRASAAAKAAATPVTLQHAVENELVVTIDKHFEVSRLIEDIVKIQALNSQRRFYTEDAGYALARQVDSDLIKLGRQLNNGADDNVYATAFSGADGTTAYVAGTNAGVGALTDAAIRRTIQRLDDNDLPMDDRVFVVPPSSRNTLMGISRFTEEAFVGERGSDNTIRNGKIGNVYGVEVYVTPQCESTSGTTAAKAALMFHRDALLFVEQLAVRSQTQYKQEYLADLFTADTIYGTKLLRKGNLTDVPTGGFALIVPA